MIIQASNVAMGSKRTYRATSLGLVSYSGWGNRVSGRTTTAATTLPTAMESTQTKTENRAGNAKVQVKGLRWQILTNEKEEKFTPRDAVEYGSFKSLLELLFEARENRKNWWDELLERLNIKPRQPVTRQYGKTAETHYEELRYFEESEETKFYSEGTVKTADGRCIDFDITATMSREFNQYAKVEIDYRQAAMVDPLVINLDSNTTEVREQKFLFDIDADGELDNISLLSELSGFLALDRNEDGIINDGTELFGTKSGNGFQDLAVFDLDGNGWIDENDEIFNRLRIWTKDANGKDKLVGLGVAGVGAIYLGNVSSEFSLGAANIRRTGVYLKENGEAGTIQHVDFAVS